MHHRTLDVHSHRRPRVSHAPASAPPTASADRVRATSCSVWGGSGMAHSEATFEKFQSNCREFGSGQRRRLFEISPLLRPPRRRHALLRPPPRRTPLLRPPHRRCSLLQPPRRRSSLPGRRPPVLRSKALPCSSRRAPAKRAGRQCGARWSPLRRSASPASSGQAGATASPAPVALPCAGELRPSGRHPGKLRPSRRGSLPCAGRHPLPWRRKRIEMASGSPKKFTKSPLIVGSVYFLTSLHACYATSALTVGSACQKSC
jgi:hypothetical protein